MKMEFTKEELRFIEKSMDNQSSMLTVEIRKVFEGFLDDILRVTRTERLKKLLKNKKKV